MSRPQSFRDIATYAEEFPQGVRYGSLLRPFWAVATDKSYGGPDEKAAAMLHWTNTTIEQLLEWRQPITRVQRMNSRLYAGKHYFSQEAFSNLPYNRAKRYNPEGAQIVLNYLGDATDKHVADMAGFEPNLMVLPANADEEQDKVAARMNKHCLDHYFRLHKLKTAFATFHHRKKTQGEAFMFALWDPDLGDFHPQYKELRRRRVEAGQDPDATMPLTDPVTGAQIMGDGGEPLFISRAVRVGDVSIEQEYSERVLYPCPESYLWDDVPWLIRLRWFDIDEVRARWPQLAEEIKADGMYRNYMGPVGRSLSEKVCVRFMYHKRTLFLPDGYRTVSTESTMLEVEPRSIANHDHLPCIRGTDIDLDFEITGMSFFQNLTSLNAAINSSTTMILQNQAQYAHPKYAVPRGAKVKYSDLGPERGIYEYSGPKAPEVIANNSTPPDVWRWRDAMRDEFKTLSALFGTSDGRAPDGITANVALRMIDEQERKLHKPAIDKHGENVERLGHLILATLGTYRDSSDEALITIVGKNNKRYLKHFDVENLSRPWICELQKSSGLPESPAAKTQTVLDLGERFQGLWEPDEVLEYLDIPRPEKLVQSATVARESAESEMEELLAGKDVPPPSPYHDILPRYRVFEKIVQSRDFDEVDASIKERVINHIMVAEYLISQKMKLNPAFAQEVMTKHFNFPMFFTPMMPQPEYLLPEPAPLQMDPQMAAAMGMANGVGAPDLGGMPPEAAGPDTPMPPPEESQMPNAAPAEQPAVPSPGALP